MLQLGAGQVVSATFHFAFSFYKGEGIPMRVFECVRAFWFCSCWSPNLCWQGQHGGLRRSLNCFIAGTIKWWHGKHKYFTQTDLLYGFVLYVVGSWCICHMSVCPWIPEVRSGYWLLSCLFCGKRAKLQLLNFCFSPGRCSKCCCLVSVCTCSCAGQQQGSAVREVLTSFFFLIDLSQF